MWRQAELVVKSPDQIRRAEAAQASQLLDGDRLIQPAGSFYTEPPNRPHFARTLAEPVVVYITGYGPTDTNYVDSADAPSPD